MKIILQNSVTSEMHKSLENYLRLRYALGYVSRKIIVLEHDLSAIVQAELRTKFPCIIDFSEEKLPLVKTAENILTEFAIIAGPCAVESEEQMHAVAKVVASSGAQFLRGGAFKPRTSPYDFQGLGVSGLAIMSEVAKQYKLQVVSEVMCVSQIDAMLAYVDIFQVGARNMQNFSLLKILGQIERPVLLKRSATATYNEFLAAAEYILAAGNSRVILCERGIKSFEPMTRNTLDLSIVPVLKAHTNLPILIDPSHAVGLSDAVPALARAAVAAGASGVMVEVHPCPSESVSDAKQALSLSEYSSLVESIDKIRRAMLCKQF